MSITPIDLDEEALAAKALMSDLNPIVLLPTPRKSRWQPLRDGLVDIFYYDNQEFRFHDGRLLLRGNDGTGKSKVLALTLPFLLDGELTPSRVEPDGDRGRRMEWDSQAGGRGQGVGRPDRPDQGGHRAAARARSAAGPRAEPWQISDRAPGPAGNARPRGARILGAVGRTDRRGRTAENRAAPGGLGECRHQPRRCRGPRSRIHHEPASSTRRPASSILVRAGAVVY